MTRATEVRGAGRRSAVRVTDQPHGGNAMLMLLNLMLQRVRDERGVVSVEWIILGAVMLSGLGQPPP